MTAMSVAMSVCYVGGGQILIHPQTPTSASHVPVAGLRRLLLLVVKRPV